MEAALEELLDLFTEGIILKREENSDESHEMIIEEDFTFLGYFPEW